MKTICIERFCSDRTQVKTSMLRMKAKEAGVEGWGDTSNDKVQHCTQQSLESAYLWGDWGAGVTEDFFPLS